MREQIKVMIDTLGEAYNGESVVIYGCTVFSKEICFLLRKKGISVDAFVDNDKRKAGDKYLGINVFLPEQYLQPFDENKLVIICSVHEEEMLYSLYKMGYGDKNILHISMEREGVRDSLEYAEEQKENIRDGMKFYEELQLEYGDGTVILVAPEASGDIFLACAYLKPWRRLYEINNCVLAGVNKNISDIAEMYGFYGMSRLISTKERNSLLAVYMFIGEQLHIKLLSGWVLEKRNSCVVNPQSPFLFKEAFQYETYQLGKDVVPEYPKRSRQSFRDNFFRMKEGKTIIISPYAYSSPAPMISIGIWEEIANILCRRGYCVYTVGYGEKEPPIKGTSRIQFSYREACDVLEYAGGFLASRSGLCDIVHMANCRQLVIYGKNIRNLYSADFFCLKKNYPGFHGKEIIFDDYETRDFIKCVTEHFSIL